MRKEWVFKFGSSGKTRRSMATTHSRVRKCPDEKMNNGGEDVRRAWQKCQRAETGQRGEGRAKRAISTPLPKRSVLEEGRKRFALDRSSAKVRWERSSVLALNVDEEGEANSDARSKVKKAEENAAQSMQASCGEKTRVR